MKIAQGVRPCGAFIFHISVKSKIKISIFGVLHIVVAPMGAKFGMEEETVPSSVLNVTLIGATTRV